MQFTEWEPVYEAIIADFGFNRATDERARDVLGGLTGPFDRGRLSVFDRATVAVVGAGPSLPDELDRVRAADAVVAASTAADVLMEAGVAVDVLVTDLDKNPATSRDLTVRGVPVVVHAHGDNIQAVREQVPTFVGEHVLPTTQAKPRRPVENFGGFTDGDRAAFLADHFGAAALLFPGWDFDDHSVDPEKRRKLSWAKRLLYWLERRRDQQFGVLDGRRDSIDTSALPV